MLSAPLQEFCLMKKLYVPRSRFNQFEFPCYLINISPDGAPIIDRDTAVDHKVIGLLQSAV